jgi:hypothetical protein
VALALVSSPAISQIQPKSGGYLFRYRFTSGRTYKYTVKTTIWQPTGKSISFSGPYLETVKGIKAEKGMISAVLGPFKSPTATVMPSMEFRYYQSTLGKIQGPPNVPQSPVVFQESPVKIGQSWEGSTSGQALGSNTVIKAKYTLVRLTTVKGHRVAELRVVFTSKGQSDTSGTGTIDMLADDGSIFSSSMNLTMTAPKSNQMMRIESIVARN